MSIKETILIIEDEKDIQELVAFHLKKEGYIVLCSDSSEEAKSIIAKEKISLIVLDLMLPGVDGLEFLRRLRETGFGAIPVIILSARSDDIDIVSGLEVGADDFVTKPFNPRLLVARIRAVLRRIPNDSSEKNSNRSDLSDNLSSKIAVEKIIDINTEKFEARIKGNKLSLTATEFKILNLLAEKKGRVYSRYQIVDIVHGEDYPVTDRSIDVQITSLRKKLGTYSDLIETVRGMGYRFKEV